MEKVISSSKEVCKCKQISTAAEIKIYVETSTPTMKRRKQMDLEVNGSSHSVFYTNNPDHTVPAKETKLYAKSFKICILVLILVVCSFALMTNNEKNQDMHQCIIIPRDSVKSHTIYKKPKNSKLLVTVEGALLPPCCGNLSTDWMRVWIQLVKIKQRPTNLSRIKNSDISSTQNISTPWYVPLDTEKLTGQVHSEYKNIFDLTSNNVDNESHSLLRIQMSTNLDANFPISVSYNLHPINPKEGIIYAALILTGLYVLIIFDLVHRTLAAMLASTISVAILAVLNERPTMDEIVSWVDIETLLLLFSMMILVTVFSETGIIDYSAVYAYKVTGGKLWPLIHILCALTTLLSCFLDNVTTALLITPITIKLCEVMKLDPTQILMYTLIFSNIGGAITPIGDPPNVLIASNPDVIKSGVHFGVFTLHMGVGAILVLIAVYIQIRIMYRDISYYKSEEPPVVQELKREIAVWERTAASVGSYSKDEEAVKDTLMKKTALLQSKLKLTVNTNASGTEENYATNLNDLEKQYPIRDKGLLVKSGVTLFLVIFVFFLHSIPALSRLGLGWTAFLGVLLLLLLYDNQDIEGIFARVEWSTLLFFASLFILMEALSRLGLINLIGKQTEYIITLVGQESRLTVAIILILWVSAVASAFVDNLPLTTMMIRIAVDLSNNSELRLPLQPLVWSLSFGACLGGNGSLVGSSSNIVCAGVAEQHGYRFTFMQFSKLNNRPICGAVIISKDTGLTAAHCIPKRGSYSVRAGSTYLYEGGVIVHVKQAIVHPYYTKENQDFDIAILKFVESLRFSEKIKPVNLPKDDKELPPGVKGHISGWGSISSNYPFVSEELRVVEVPVYNTKLCTNIYRDTVKITSRMFCAGYQEGGKDSCQGDSGGPFVVNGTLYGLVSWGVDCALAGYPGVYTKISVFRNYIRRNSGV